MVGGRSMRTAVVPEEFEKYSRRSSIGKYGVPMEPNTP